MTSKTFGERITQALRRYRTAYMLKRTKTARAYKYALSRTTSKEVLSKIATTEDNMLRMVVAANPSTPYESIINCLEDATIYVKDAAAHNPKLVEAMENHIGLLINSGLPNDYIISLYLQQSNSDELLMPAYKMVNAMTVSGVLSEKELESVTWLISWNDYIKLRMSKARKD